MRYGTIATLILCGCLGGVTPTPVRAADVNDLLDKGRAALAKGAAKQALELADKAVEAEPKNAEARLFRGVVHETLGDHAEAIADFDRVLELDPKAAEAYNHRGSEQFKLGHVAESLADFDRFLELRPDERPGHWKRGISLYYLGKFDAGRKQFEGYEKVDTNDVENAVWHYLCTARLLGPDKARAALLKIGKDARVPMTEVYALFGGKAKPEDVLAAAEEGRPSAAELRQRLFYAHLYLGLYAEVNGDKKEALEHMGKAAGEYRIGHYMGDVARVHAELLRKETKPK
jgi:lipoprotein NlpI